MASLEAEHQRVEPVLGAANARAHPRDRVRVVPSGEREEDVATCTSPILTHSWRAGQQR